jgi:starvation-inducible DNA-binding protein
MRKAIDNSRQDAEEILAFLNTLLNAEYALYNKTRRVYWNTNGPNHSKLREFIKNNFSTIDCIIVAISELVRSFGHFALGSLDEFMSITHIDEEKQDFGNSAEIIQTLVSDHETIIRTIRDEIPPISENNIDVETIDFIHGLICQHEKMTFLLTSFSS